MCICYLSREDSGTEKTVRVARNEDLQIINVQNSLTANQGEKVNMVLVGPVIRLTFLRQNSVVNLTGVTVTVIITAEGVTINITERFRIPRR